MEVDLLSIDMLDENLGFVSGRAGHILSTTDGGSTWARDTIATEATIFRVHRVEDSVLYAYTGNKIFKRDLRSVQVAIEEIQPIASTIGPNPSTGSIKITTSELPARIMVFDMKGRQVRVERSLSLEVQLNLDHLDSGAYILVIEFPDGRRSEHKILLIPSE